MPGSIYVRPAGGGQLRSRGIAGKRECANKMTVPAKWPHGRLGANRLKTPLASQIRTVQRLILFLKLVDSVRARKRLTLNTALLPKPRGAKAVTKGVSEACRGQLMPAFGTPFSTSSWNISALEFNAYKFRCERILIPTSFLDPLDYDYKYGAFTFIGAL